MAYSRWGQGSDWYIFWETTPAAAKADETLAIWNSDVRDRTFSATYREVVAMLSSGDFSSIPGYSPNHRSVVADALAAFVGDVDIDYSRRA